VDRAVTDLEVVSPLLFGQILSRVKREAVGVVGVIEEPAYVVEIHSFSSKSRQDLQDFSGFRELS
jgi:hypothetical protein